MSRRRGGPGRAARGAGAAVCDGRPRRGRLAAGLVVLAALAWLPGCSISRFESGRAVPDTAALQVGVSTKADVMAALGPPLEVRRQFDGDLFIYRRVLSQSRQILLFPLLPFYADQRGSSRQEQVTLLFDPRGVLTGVGRHVP